MISYNQGAVILIPFPFTDFSALKQRPAVIISRDEFNKRHNDIVALAITSQIPETIPAEDYALGREDIESAHLPKPSLVKTGKIITISKMLIRKRLGSLPPSTIEKIQTLQ